MLRRADPDDLEAILNLVEIGEEDIYGRVYSYPNVLKLIETAYMTITAIDRDGNIVAFAAFEDYPMVSERDRIRVCEWDIGRADACVRCLPSGRQATPVLTCFCYLRSRLPAA